MSISPITNDAHNRQLGIMGRRHAHTQKERKKERKKERRHEIKISSQTAAEEEAEAPSAPWRRASELGIARFSGLEQCGNPETAASCSEKKGER